MTSDVFGSFLTYLPTLIRYRQMWLDLPTLPLDLTSDFEKIPLQLMCIIQAWYDMELILLFICKSQFNAISCNILMTFKGVFKALEYS